VTKLKFYFSVLLTIFIISEAQAKTVYVTDQFKITLRSGQSSQHKITRMLPTGTPLTVKRVHSNTGYTEVMTPQGSHGFVLTRQLIKQPAARERLIKAEEKIAKLISAPSQLQKSLSEITDSHDKLKTEHTELTQVNKELDFELTTLKRTSANAVQISEERNSLRKKVATIMHDMANIKQENQELENNLTQQWFLIGGGVLVLGIILGLILPHLRIRKQSNNWDTL